jgi:hypothetical protein
MYHGHGGRGSTSGVSVATLVSSLRSEWDCRPYEDPLDAFEALGFAPCPDRDFAGVGIDGRWLRYQTPLSLRSSGSQLYRLLAIIVSAQFQGVREGEIFDELVYPHAPRMPTLAALLDRQQHARERDLERIYLERHGSGAYPITPELDSDSAPVSRR